MRGERSNRNLRCNFFTQRVVSIWNKLPDEVVEADTIKTIKGHLGRYMDRKCLEEYGPNARKWDKPRWGILVSMNELG